MLPVPTDRRRSVDVTTILSPDLIEAFALAHAGPTAGVTQSAQAQDYAGKVSVLASEFEAAFEAPMTVGDLLGEIVDRLLVARRRNGQPLVAASRNAYRRVVRSFATWLHRTERFPGCPRPLCQDEREEERTPVFFDAAELRRLFAFLLDRDRVCDRRLAAAITVALDTSARAADVTSLRRSALDRQRGTVSLLRKNSVRSELPLTSTSWAAIDRYLAVRTSSRPELFLTDDESAPLTAKALGKAFTRTVRAAGLRAEGNARQKDLSFQALRRTFVTKAAKARMSVDELCAFTGWDADYAHQVIPAYRRPDVADLVLLQAAMTPLRDVFVSDPVTPGLAEG